MSDRREYQCGEQDDYYDDIVFLSDNYNNSYSNRGDIRRDLIEIKRGIKEERIGLRDIIKRNINKGIREVSIGIKGVQEGLEDLEQDLKDLRLNHNDLRDIEEAIKEIKEGLEFASRGIRNIARCRTRQGIQELLIGIRKEEEGFDELLRILTNMIYEDDYNDCECSEYNSSDQNIDIRDIIRDITVNIDINRV